MFYYGRPIIPKGKIQQQRHDFPNEQNRLQQIHLLHLSTRGKDKKKCEVKHSACQHAEKEKRIWGQFEREKKRQGNTRGEITWTGIMKEGYETAWNKQLKQLNALELITGEKHITLPLTAPPTPIQKGDERENWTKRKLHSKPPTQMGLLICQAKEITKGTRTH